MAAQISLPREKLALFPGVPSPLLQLPFVGCLFIALFLPEPGRKWDFVVFHPQEETAPSLGPSWLAGLCAPGPCDSKSITRGVHLLSV